MLLFKLISMLSNKMATLILRSKQNGSTNVDMFRQCDIPIEFNLMIQNGLWNKMAGLMLNKMAALMIKNGCLTGQQNYRH